MNPTDAPIHEVLTSRWSPYGFDPEKAVESETLRSLFEAARWSMSSYNAQPWRYIVANRATDEPLWNQVLETLVQGNRGWAEHAPVLALGLTKTTFEHNGKPNTAAFHDLGAASACLTFEATARGLVVHQMVGIVSEKVRETFSLEDSIEPLTALAIGYEGKNDLLAQEFKQRDARKRERKTFDDIILFGTL